MWYIIIAVIVVLYFVGKSAQKQTPKKEITVSVKVSTSPDYLCKIAGVQYRNDAQDIGGFLGYVCSEPTNPHDKNAIAIYRNDGKHVGYIPKDETKDFREWSAKENLPCVGFIKDGDEVALYGKVKVIDTDADETELEVVKFVKWLVSNFGVKFIPVGFNVDTDKTLRTKKDWLAFLTEYIDEKENELYEE
ncbi:MAG: HIRAN domain-containing protein [Clostridia bacterium]|nr:HIRAN domain-containing protein [Clostridia bacterium]